MTILENQWQISLPTTTGDAEAIRYLKQAIRRGEPWHIALLETIGLWSATEETYHDRTYHYLIAGEAFDWLLLAERLCDEIDSLLPDNEKTALLFHGRLPADLSTEKFKKLIGDRKYRQYLNYFYGITIEEALILAVHDEVRKERWVSGYNGEHDTVNDAYQRIYGATKTALLTQFRRENSHPQHRSTSLTELKEFTYWLFKYRLKQCDKARVASDTRKALERWRQQPGFTPAQSALSP
jgi:PAS domain-containing protein